MRSPSCSAAPTRSAWCRWPVPRRCMRRCPTPTCGSGTSTTPCMKSKSAALLNHARPFEEPFRAARRRHLRYRNGRSTRRMAEQPPAGARAARRHGGEWRTPGDVRNARDSVHRFRFGVPRISPSTRSPPSASPPSPVRASRPAWRWRMRKRAIRLKYGRSIAKPSRDGSSDGLIFRQREAGPCRRPHRGEVRGIFDRTVCRRRRGDLRRAGNSWTAR